MPLRGELDPHLTQCRLGRAYVRTKWHLDPSSHLATTDMNRKLGGCSAPFLRELGLHLTKCGPYRPRATSTPSGILIRPAVWLQYTNVTDRQDRQRSGSIGRTVLQTVAQKRGNVPIHF